MHWGQNQFPDCIKSYPGARGPHVSLWLQILLLGLVELNIAIDERRLPLMACLLLRTDLEAHFDFAIRLLFWYI